jgi:DNA-binding NarL/FixJ family response regulator
LEKTMLTETTETLEEQHPPLGRELAKNSINARFPTKRSKPQSPTSIKLTPREQEILTLVATGDTSKRIGDTLDLSTRTIERHRANLLKKFNQKNSVSLIQSALHHGLL